MGKVVLLPGSGPGSLESGPSTKWGLGPDGEMQPTEVRKRMEGYLGGYTPGQSAEEQMRLGVGRTQAQLRAQAMSGGANPAAQRAAGWAGEEMAGRADTYARMLREQEALRMAQQRAQMEQYASGLAGGLYGAEEHNQAQAKIAWEQAQAAMAAADKQADANVLAGGINMGTAFLGGLVGGGGKKDESPSDIRFKTNVESVGEDEPRRSGFNWRAMPTAEEKADVAATAMRATDAAVPSGEIPQTISLLKELRRMHDPGPGADAISGRIFELEERLPETFTQTIRSKLTPELLDEISSREAGIPVAPRQAPRGERLTPDQRAALIGGELESADLGTMAAVRGNRPAVTGRDRAERLGEELDELAAAAKPYRFGYKPEVAGAFGLDLDERFGVMAQNLEKTPAGRELVKDTPAGKVIDSDKALGASLAMAGRLDQRLRKLEDRRIRKPEDRLR